MRKLISMLMLVFVVSALLAGCASKAAAPEKPVPADYAGKTNPVSGQADVITAGKDVYTTNCSSCHGDSGTGDGPAGASLDPKPADLVAILSKVSDDRVFWIVNEGGAAAGLSASMVSWKDTLSEDEIWQVIAYLRTLK